MSLIPTITILLTILTLSLSLSILSVAAHLLSTYNAQRTTNIWFLPLWPAHFELRELSTIISTSSVIFLLDGILLFSTLRHFFHALFAKKLPLAFMETCLSGLATLLAIVAVAVPAATNTLAPPTRDTLMTWTCRWSGSGDAIATATNGGTSNNVPEDFGELCRESKFAFYGTIPLLLLQCGLFGCVMWTFVTERRIRALQQQQPRSLEQVDGRKDMRKGEFEKLKDYDGKGGLALREMAFA